MDLEDIKRRYLSGEGSTSIAKDYGLSGATILYHLKKNGVKPRSDREKSLKNRADSDYFKKIDSPEKAYYLGLIFADGYITSDLKNFGISLKTSDAKDVLERMKSHIGFTGDIKYYSATTTYGPTSYGRLLLSDPSFVAHLKDKGCVEKKSLILMPPIGVPLEFEKYFIQGYIDGDGSYAKSKSSKTGLVLKIIGTKEMLEWISYRIPSDKNPSIHQYKNKRGVYQVQFTITQEILEYVNDGKIVGMQRKQSRWLHAKRVLQKDYCGCRELCQA